MKKSGFTGTFAGASARCRRFLFLATGLACAAANAAAGFVAAGVVPVRPPVALPVARYVAVDPNHAGTVYAAVQDAFTQTYGPVGSTAYKSTDAGTTWIEVGQTFLHSATLFGIAVDRDSTVYVNSSGDGIHRSTDGGATWSPSLAYVGWNIIADPITGGTLYAYWTSGIIKSTDSGDTWTSISNGLPVPLPGEPAGPAVGCLAIDPHNHDILYAGVHERGVCKSTNGGSNWEVLDMGLHPSAVVSLALDPDDPSIVYAGTAEDGLFKTTDGGTHWSPVATGQLNPQVFALAVDQDSTVYAGIYDCCVLRSTDGGTTWSDANPDMHLHIAYVRVLVADPSLPGTIYAGCN